MYLSFALVFHQISEICISYMKQKTDSVTLTFTKLGSLLVKRFIKIYKDFMHSSAATQSKP